MNDRIEEILRNPSVLKTPEGDDYTDEAPAKWAWLAHGYDTGMEPFYSIDQLREAVRSVVGEKDPSAPKDCGQVLARLIAEGRTVR